MIGSYSFISVILFVFFNIDILVPCVFKKIFHFECWGCGLTTAFIHLLKFDMIAAYQSNWTIFVVIPVIVFLVCKDVLKFNNAQKMKVKIT